MELRVKFIGGPIDGRRAFVSRLDPQQIFLHHRNRMVLVYWRHDETDYVYDPEQSAKLAKDFDGTASHLASLHEKDPPASVRFEEPTK